MKKLLSFLLILALLAACAAPAGEAVPDTSTPEASDTSSVEVSPVPTAEPTPHPTPTLHPAEETPAPTGEPSPAPEPSAETARPLAGLPELTEGDLTQEEIDGFNAIFSWGSEEYDRAAAQLFANHYADITEMDLDDALYYYPDDGCLGPDDAAEKDALRDLHTLMPDVPCHRILRSSVDETLRRFAGVTTAELKTMENALYVPEYDAFYNFSSDYGPGYFTCEGGRVEGDTATLWGKSGSSISFGPSREGVRDVATLKREDGAWHIKSHVKEAVDPSASLEAFLLSLTGDDIAEISGGGAMEKDAVAELICAGCQNMLWDLWGEPREVLGTLTLTLTDGTTVSLDALDDPNIVRAAGPELPYTPAYLCHPGLYELVKANGKL